MAADLGLDFWTAPARRQLAHCSTALITFKTVAGPSLELTSRAWARDSVSNTWRTLAAFLDGTIAEALWCQASARRPHSLDSLVRRVLARLERGVAAVRGLARGRHGAGGQRWAGGRGNIKRVGYKNCRRQAQVNHASGTECGCEQSRVTAKREPARRLQRPLPAAPPAAPRPAPPAMSQ
eukprot:XP_001700518.1 predicted protein [Chlamydomonas reinhardtii]